MLTSVITKDGPKGMTAKMIRAGTRVSAGARRKITRSAWAGMMSSLNISLIGSAMGWRGRKGEGPDGLLLDPAKGGGLRHQATPDLLGGPRDPGAADPNGHSMQHFPQGEDLALGLEDRTSTRLYSSHSTISY